MCLEFGLTAWTIGLGLLFPLLYLLRKRNGLFLLMFVLFWLYLMSLVGVIVFPVPVINNYGLGFDSIADQLRFMQEHHSLNLIPFYFGDCWELPNACKQGIIKNILLTMPFGFLFPFLLPLPPKRLPYFALAVGLGLEGSQLLLDLLTQSAIRIVDINDVLFNALGVGIGYISFSLLQWGIARLIERFGS